MTCVGFWNLYGSNPGTWGIIDGLRQGGIWILMVFLGIRDYWMARRALRRGLLQGGLHTIAYVTVIIMIGAMMVAISKIPLPN